MKFTTILDCSLKWQNFQSTFNLKILRLPPWETRHNKYFNGNNETLLQLNICLSIKIGKVFSQLVQYITYFDIIEKVSPLFFKRFPSRSMLKSILSRIRKNHSQMFFKTGGSLKFCNIHRETPALESLF